jgi:Ca-activated chloride channel family protein
MTHDDPRLTEYALGELDGPDRAAERAEVEAALAADAGLRAEVDAIRDSAGVLRGGLAAETVPVLDAAHRGVIEKALGTVPSHPQGGHDPVVQRGLSPVLTSTHAGLGALAATLLLAIGFTIAGATGGVEFGAQPDPAMRRLASSQAQIQTAGKIEVNGDGVGEYGGFFASDHDRVVVDLGRARGGLMPGTNCEVYAIDKGGAPVPSRPRLGSVMNGKAFYFNGVGAGGGGGGGAMLLRSAADIHLQPSGGGGFALPASEGALGEVTNGLDDGASIDTRTIALSGVAHSFGGDRDSTTESFGSIVENAWVRPLGEAALSTFSIDVDTAAYAVARRCLLEQGRLPPPGALRIEELVNYFPYAYAPPAGSDPFAVHVDAASCPWNARHRLVRIALKGREVEEAVRPAANLVLLLDVSGSMNQPNKLPLVKQSIELLSKRLTSRDRVAMVVYAGASGLALPSTTGDRQSEILGALGRLEAGGSTNGGAGIELAYKVATENFVRGGINRVVLATDGDFNVGVAEPSALVKLVEEKAKSGVFLTTLGYGMDNLKDSTLEQLADKGNGNYGYIDTVREAEKVLVDEGMSTLHAIAKDVKIQVEFNPARVAGYRLLGYENRVLAAQDFNDDAKDAGEIGAGHTVTAFYEVVPAGDQVPGAAVDELRYQRIGGGAVVVDGVARYTETLTVKLRWKEPEGTTSTLLEVPFSDDGRAFDAAPEDFRFAASVAAFGMVLRDSAHKGDAGLPMVREIAAGALGDDRGGYRAEFLTLVDKAAALK